MQDPTSPPPASTVPATRPQVWLRRLPLIVILSSAVLGAILLRSELGLESLARHHHTLMAFRDAHYALAAASFTFAYLAIAALSLPGALVASLAGGLLFGLFPGSLFCVFAAGTGAMVVFLAARAGIGTAVMDRLSVSSGAGARLADRLRKNEWSMLFVMRLVPIVPFFLANLVPAMLGTSFWRFAVSTYLGIIPGAILFTSVGSGLGEACARGEAPDLSLLYEPVIYAPLLGLLALVLLPLVLNSQRKDR